MRLTQHGHALERRFEIFLRRKGENFRRQVTLEGGLRADIVIAAPGRPHLCVEIKRTARTASWTQVEHYAALIANVCGLPCASLVVARYAAISPSERGKIFVAPTWREAVDHAIYERVLFLF